MAISAQPPDSPLSATGGPSDEELLRRVAAGEEAAFAALVHRHEREVFGYLRRYLGDAQQAEDVFQATFLRVHQKRSQFIEGRRFRPWLYAIATHQAIDSQRRNRRHRMASLDKQAAGSEAALIDSVADREALSDEALESAEAATWVRSAVERLPQKLRDTLDLVYRRGLKHREAAALLGIPVGTVKSRIANALGRLHRASLRGCARPAFR